MLTSGSIREWIMNNSQHSLENKLAGVLDACSRPDRGHFPAALEALLDVCAALGMPAQASNDTLEDPPASVTRSFDCERAMLSCLAGIGAGFMVSRSPTGYCVATVFHADLFDETTFQSEDLAFAMLGAIATALVGVLESQND